MFLQEKGVQDNIIRRLTPTFSAEVGRRKLELLENSCQIRRVVPPRTTLRRRQGESVAQFFGRS